MTISPDAVPRMTRADVPMARDRGEGWAFLRAAGRVVRVDDEYFITHREDVERVLRDPQVFSSKAAFDFLGSPLPLVPIAFDPPEHTRYRHVLQPFFNPRALAALLPSLQAQIDDLVRGLAARLAQGDVVDVMADLATPYPSQVFLTLFGLPVADAPRLIRWKDAVITMSTAPEEERDLQPALELAGYLVEAIAAKRAAPSDDILSALLTGPEPLDDAEALGLGFLFVLAGLDTVTAAIGFALERLACDPGLRARATADESTIVAFIEEVVRLEPPAPMVPRATTADVSVGDVTIPSGSSVVVCLASANRESSEYPDADDLHVDAEIRRHWGFGGGPHRCLGMHLARMELRLVIDAWHRYIPDYALAPGHVPEIPWPAGTFGYASLPLVGAPAGSAGG